MDRQDVFFFALQEIVLHFIKDIMLSGLSKFFNKSPVPVFDYGRHENFNRLMPEIRVIKTSHIFNLLIAKLELSEIGL